MVLLAMRTKPAFAIVASSLLTLAAACGGSSSNDGPFPDTSSGSSSSGTSGSSSGTLGSSSGGSTSGEGDGGSCAAVAAETTKAKVDIIFVIDDSGSMTEEMNQIKTNVNTFAQKIGTSGLDYTVTFIVKKGTSGNTICVPAPLAGAACADNAPLFHHVNQDVQSTDSFQLILQTYDQSWNAFVRMDATKVFIEVSDDRSQMTYTAFDTALLAKAPAGMFGTAAARNYIFHSIVSKPFADAIPSNNICSTAAGPSVDYQQLSKLTGGIVDEVCKTDYSGVLDNIAKGITDKLACTLTYPKADADDPTKVVVTFTPMGAPSQTLTQVTDMSKCDANPDAWYYDDAANPSKIILCPTTCTAVDTAASSKIQALVGCKGATPK